VYIGDSLSGDNSSGTTVRVVGGGGGSGIGYSGKVLILTTSTAGRVGGSIGGSRSGGLHSGLLCGNNSGVVRGILHIHIHSADAVVVSPGGLVGLTEVQLAVVHVTTTLVVLEPGRSGWDPIAVVGIGSTSCEGRDDASGVNSANRSHVLVLNEQIATRVLATHCEVVVDRSSGGLSAITSVGAPTSSHHHRHRARV